MYIKANAVNSFHGFISRWTRWIETSAAALLSATVLPVFRVAGFLFSSSHTLSLAARNIDFRVNPEPFYLVKSKTLVSYLLFRCRPGLPKSCGECYFSSFLLPLLRCYVFRFVSMCRWFTRLEWLVLVVCVYRMKILAVVGTVITLQRTSSLFHHDTSIFLSWDRVGK